MLAMSIAANLGYDQKTLVELGTGCLIHDAGMLRLEAGLGTEDRLLTPRELEDVASHPLYTFDMLASHLDAVPVASRLVAYQIHERCDGSGYPRRRQTATIHPLARIAAVADVFVALISPRPYRPALMPYYAMEHLLRGAAPRCFRPGSGPGAIEHGVVVPAGFARYAQRWPCWQSVAQQSRRLQSTGSPGVRFGGEAAHRGDCRSEPARLWVARRACCGCAGRCGLNAGYSHMRPDQRKCSPQAFTSMKSIVCCFSVFVLAWTASLWAADQYYDVSYPPSDKTGELQFGVTYTIWIPDGVTKLRGVIVHQHGCGTGACRGGATAAYDLHWQALARKWDCALLGPSYQQEDKQNCRLWCDPRNGSEKAFLKALDDLALRSGHAELSRVPWCLWGHSGGAFWASLMQMKYPERIVAIWFRSGTAFSTWEKGEITKPEIPAAAYGIPMMCNPGAKENGDKRFNGAGAAPWRCSRLTGRTGADRLRPRPAHGPRVR